MYIMKHVQRNTSNDKGKPLQILRASTMVVHLSIGGFACPLHGSTFKAIILVHRLPKSQALCKVHDRSNHHAELADLVQGALDCHGGLRKDKHPIEAGIDCNYMMERRRYKL